MVIAGPAQKRRKGLAWKSVRGPPSLRDRARGCRYIQPLACSTVSMAALSLKKGHELMEYKGGIVERKFYETGTRKS